MRECGEVHVPIRPALATDAPVLRELQRRAGQQFRAVGLDGVADNEPPSEEVLAGYANAGRSWVASDDMDRIIGFVLVDEVDDAAHIEQVSVLPDHQGRGVGRALIDRARNWAVENGRSALTLLTFDQVSWNRPLYEHLGFRVLTEEEMGPGLQGIRDNEAAHGLDPATRVAMRLEL